MGLIHDILCDPHGRVDYNTAGQVLPSNFFLFSSLFLDFPFILLFIFLSHFISTIFLFRSFPILS